MECESWKLPVAINAGSTQLPKVNSGNVVVLIVSSLTEYDVPY